MSICLPCAKEIINSDARGAWQKSHSIAAALQGHVAAGRLSSTDAEEVLNALIAADQDYIAAVNAVAETYLEKVDWSWGS